MEVGFPAQTSLGRYGIGFNRRTWNLGRAIGTVAKKGIKSYFTNKKRKAAPATRRAAKKAKTTAYGYQAPTGGGDSKSSFSLVKSPSTKLTEVASELAPSVVVNNSTLRAEAGVGQQLFFLAGTYFTDDDINQGFTLLNPGTTAKIYLSGVRGEALITNQENVNARMTIYDVIARKDTDATVTDPLAAVMTGYADNTGGSANDYLIPGASPFSNSRFTEYFKVLQKTDVILSPGACHSHVVNYKPSKYFSHQLSSRVAGSGIGGLTVYTLVQFHGTPINDVTNQAQISLSHIALDMVQKEEYKFQYLHASVAASSMTNSLPASFTNAGNTMQDDGVELAANEA